MDVIWLLHGDVLSKIRRALRSPTIKGSKYNVATHGQRVPLIAFVCEVYRACLDNDQGPGFAGCHHQARQLVESICNLFDLVDIDDTGVIDWVDFTDFCVHMRGGYQDGLEDGGGADRSDGCGALAGKSDKDSNITHFAERLGFVDRCSHSHEIRSMRFVKELQLLLVIEGGSALKVYRIGPHKIGDIEPAVAMRKHFVDTKTRSVRMRQRGGKRGGGGGSGGEMRDARRNEDNTAVLAAEFIGRDNQAALSCADGFLTVWELDNCTMLRFTHMKDVQVGLRFCPAMKVLASWGVDDFNHDILIWDVDALLVMHVLNDGHYDPVRDVCEVALPNSETSADYIERPWNPLLATAAMDGKVVVWDLRLSAEGQVQTPRKLFILTGHYHGILSLVYSDEHDLILSAGFDFDALCWERSTSHLHMKLEGHRRSLIGVAIVQHETQRAVTGDEGGAFRLWDIRRGHSDHGKCLQAFCLRNSRASPRTMVVTWREGLIAAGSKMHIFRASRTVAVGANPAGAWFSSYTGEIWVLLRNVVMLDGTTGKISQRAMQPSSGRDITAFCVDARHKKAIVGDQQGSIRMYDGVTGRSIMSATPHRSEVSALIFIDEDSAFVSAGWDRKIQVHDARVRSPNAVGRNHNYKVSSSSSKASVPVFQRRATLLRSVTGAHEGDITLLAASARLGLLATASNDLTVRVWDYTLLRLEEIIVAHRQEITCVCFLEPLPCLATADMAGKVLIWATRPHRNAKSLLVVIRNTIITVGETPKDGETRRIRAQRKVLATPVTSIAFCHAPGPGDSDDKINNHDTVGHSAGRSHPPTMGDVQTLETGENETSVLREKHGDSEEEANNKGTVVDRRSTLFTGDQLGSIKKWDIFNILTDRLGRSFTCNPDCFTEDKAAAEAASLGGGTNSHHHAYHRDSPLGGVSPHVAVRFRQLIEIANIVRQGGNVPPTPVEADGSNTKRVHRNDGSFFARSGSGVECEPSLSRDDQPAADVDDSDVAASSVLPLAGDLSSRLAASGASSDRDRQQYRQQLTTSADGAYGDVYAEIEGILTAPADSIDPVASWTAHTDSVTSMQMVPNPPALLTGSLDSSVRLLSLDGEKLGVVMSQGEAGTEPWLFRPPATGRKLEASKRAAVLEEQLESIRRSQRRKIGGTPIEASPEQTTPGQQQLPTDQRCSGGAAGTHRSVPTNDSTLGPSPEQCDRTYAGAGRVPEGLSRISTAVVRERTINGDGGLDTQSALSAACLSRIKEPPSHVRAEPSEDSAIASNNRQASSQESIDARLMKEAREGRSGQYGSEFAWPSAVGSPTRGRHLDEEGKTRGVREVLPQKIPIHLQAEQERKYAKRTRSALQFLASGISIAVGGNTAVKMEATPPAQSRPSQGVARESDTTLSSTKERLFTAAHTPREMGIGTRHSTGHVPVLGRLRLSPEEIAVECGSGDPYKDQTAGTPLAKHGLRTCASAPVIRNDAMAMVPLLTLKLSGSGNLGFVSLQEGTRNSAGGKVEVVPLSQRSTASHTGVLKSPNSIVSSRSHVLVGNEITTMLNADHRRRRIDSIIDGARRIEEGGMGGEEERQKQQQQQSHTTGRLVSLTATSTNALDSTSGAARDVLETVEEHAEEGARGKGIRHVISDRARTVLSRFERAVCDEVGGGLLGESGRGGSGAVGDLRNVFDIRRREKRKAARRSAIKHNERYRRAQRFNLAAMKETQQRRQEAMVGLSGPTGDRFGPYSMEDVFEFHAFVNHLGSQGAELLTVRGLMNNSGIRDDPYTHALLQELERTRVLQWNQALSIDDMMQLVFHFAKHEDIRRMVNAMDIALLVDRVRDAFLATKGEFLTKDVNLPSPVASDVDITFRATGTDACGTCTVKELHAMMARAGSALFAHGQENLEALALQCGVDGHKELTARDFTAIITKLALIASSSSRST